MNQCVTILLHFRPDFVGLKTKQLIWRTPCKSIYTSKLKLLCTSPIWPLKTKITHNLYYTHHILSYCYDLWHFSKDNIAVQLNPGRFVLKPGSKNHSIFWEDPHCSCIYLRDSTSRTVMLGPRSLTFALCVFILAVLWSQVFQRYGGKGRDGDRDVFQEFQARWWF